MSISIVTRPAAHPVTLTDVKGHLNVEHAEHDALIDTMIASATDYCEQYTCRDFIQRTWDYSLNKFSDPLKLPKNPVLSVASVTYIDATASPESQTVSTDVYALDSGVSPAVLYLNYGKTWPTPRTQRNAVTVRFTTGYTGLGSPQDLRGNVPEGVKTAIKMLVSDMYRYRETRLDMQVYHNPTADVLLNPYRIYL